MPSSETHFRPKFDPPSRIMSVSRLDQQLDTKNGHPSRQKRVLFDNLSSSWLQVTPSMEKFNNIRQKLRGTKGGSVVDITKSWQWILLPHPSMLNFRLFCVIMTWWGGRKKGRFTQFCNGIFYEKMLIYKQVSEYMLSKIQNSYKILEIKKKIIKLFLKRTVNIRKNCQKCESCLRVYHAGILFSSLSIHSTAKIGIE